MDEIAAGRAQRWQRQVECRAECKAENAAEWRLEAGEPRRIYGVGNRRLHGRKATVVMGLSQRWTRLVNAAKVNAVMPGWDSLEAVARIHGAAEIAGLVLLALLLTGAVLLFQRRGAWPEWIDFGSYQVRGLAWGVAAGALLAMLAVTALIAAGYGARQTALMAAAEQAHADRLRRVVAEANSRQAGEANSQQAETAKVRQDGDAKAREAGDAKVREAEEAKTRQAEEAKAREAEEAKTRQAEEARARQAEEAKAREAEAAKVRQAEEAKVRQAEEAKTRQAEQQAQELANLRLKLTEAESQLAELRRQQMQKRLSDDEKKLLIEALKPFAGQKVAIAFRLGDEDGKALAEDFVAVFGAAGWDHGGNAGMSVRRWDRDPVGIEITLNETDARAGRISGGVGALINAVRKLGLTYDNTIYMNREVPAGQALVKVGRKLRK